MKNTLRVTRNPSRIVGSYPAQLGKMSLKGTIFINEQGFRVLMVSPQHHIPLTRYKAPGMDYSYLSWTIMSLSRTVGHGVGRATKYRPYNIMHSIFSSLCTTLTNSTSDASLHLALTTYPLGTFDISTSVSVFLLSPEIFNACDFALARTIESMTPLITILSQSALLIMLCVVICVLKLAMNVLLQYSRFRDSRRITPYRVQYVPLQSHQSKFICCLYTLTDTPSDEKNPSETSTRNHEEIAGEIHSPEMFRDKFQFKENILHFEGESEGL